MNEGCDALYAEDMRARRGGVHILTNTYYYALGSACDHHRGAKVSWRTEAAAIHCRRNRQAVRQCCGCEQKLERLYRLTRARS